MRTDTQTLAKAMDILAEEIQRGDGVANAAIAEAAERLRELTKSNDRLEGLIAQRDARNVRLTTALRDCLSTFREDDKTTIITAERQEAWRDALNS
jgi:hypothetical protein